MVWNAVQYTTGLLFAVCLLWLLGLTFCLAINRYTHLFRDLYPETDRHRILEERCMDKKLGVILPLGLLGANLVEVDGATNYKTLDAPISKLEGQMAEEDQLAKQYSLFTDANRKFHKLVNLNHDYPKLAAGWRL